MKRRKKFIQRIFQHRNDLKSVFNVQSTHIPCNKHVVVLRLSATLTAGWRCVCSQYEQRWCHKHSHIHSIPMQTYQQRKTKRCCHTAISLARCELIPCTAHCSFTIDSWLLHSLHTHIYLRVYLYCESAILQLLNLYTSLGNFSHSILYSLIFDSLCVRLNSSCTLWCVFSLHRKCVVETIFI